MLLLKVRFVGVPIFKWMLSTTTMLLALVSSSIAFAQSKPAIKFGVISEAKSVAGSSIPQAVLWFLATVSALPFRSIVALVYRV